MHKTILSTSERRRYLLPLGWQVVIDPNAPDLGFCHRSAISVYLASNTRACGGSPRGQQGNRLLSYHQTCSSGIIFRRDAFRKVASVQHDPDLDYYEGIYELGDTRLYRKPVKTGSHGGRRIRGWKRIWFPNHPSPVRRQAYWSYLAGGFTLMVTTITGGPARLEIRLDAPEPAR